MSMRGLLAILVFAIASSAEAGKQPTAYSLIQRVQVEGADFLGFSLSASDDAVVAGAINAHSAGAAYVFNRDSHGMLELDATLQAPEIDQDDIYGFGSSVAVQGDRLVSRTLGTSRESTPPPTYIFDRKTDSSWNVSARLFPQLLENEDSPNYVDLGRIASIGDDLIAIPARHRILKERTILLGDRESTLWDIVPVQTVHLYQKQSDSSWQEFQLIDAEDFPGYASLDGSVTFSGEQLILTAKREDNGKRDLLVLERRESEFEIAEVIQPLPGEVYRSYSSVFQGDHALVPLASAEGLGVVGVYERSEDDGWERVATLTSGINSKFDEFGIVLALDGDLAVVAGLDATIGIEDGENIYDEQPYVVAFERSESGIWNQIDRLVEPPSFVDHSNPGRFGWSLATAGGVVYVGNGVNSAASAIYVFAPAPEPSSAMLLTCLIGLAGSFSRPIRPR